VEVVVAARLCFEDRTQIQVGWQRGLTFAELAVLVDRPSATVFREVQRNHSSRHGPKNPLGRVLASGRRGLYRWGYDARWAQRRADRHRRRPRPARLAEPGLLRTVVLACLRQRWSPEQIARRLRRDFPDRPEMWVTHETIYQAIYVQSRGNLRVELTRQVALRSGRAGRVARRERAGSVRSRRPWVADWHISTRPGQAADRAVPGHWEGDLIIGRDGGSAMITLVERTTRFVMLGRLPDGRTSTQVVTALTALASRLPATLRRTLTWDQGVELAEHDTFRIATNCPVYFCDPHSPWQRGSNENTNGLLRQYFPKGTPLDGYTQTDLDTIADELNGRPRKTLGWDTPTEALHQLLTLTS
jgi:IS30 family transposase